MKNEAHPSTSLESRAPRRSRQFSPMALIPITLLTVGIGFGIQQGEESKGDKDFVVPEFPRAESDPQKEMIEAFQKVETELENMSMLLLEASKGDTTRLRDLDGSGIEDLLRMAEGRPQGNPTTALAELLYASSAGGSKVLEGIDQIIEIAENNGDPNGMSTSESQGEDSSESQSPSGQQQSQEQSQSGQKQMQGQENPDQQGQEQGQGQQPKSNQESQGDLNQEKTKGKLQPDPSGLGQANQILPGRESWGNLPIHVRDIFRADGSADMPARYRSWIDSYYRKLNKENAR